MTSQEAIKHLKQIQQKYYPSEGISWKDDQYIEAINMAIAALEYDTDPASDDLGQKAKEIATKWKAQGLPYNAIHEAVMEMASFKWQSYVYLIWKSSSANYEKCKEEMKQLIMKNAIDGTCISKGLESGCTIESPAGMLFFQHDRFDIGDRVKIITIKED